MGFKSEYGDPSGQVLTLFNGHRLGEIPRLIYVPFSEQGDMIGEHLQRDCDEQRHEVFRGIGYIQRVVDISGNRIVVRRVGS